MAQLPVPGHAGDRELSRTDPPAASRGDLVIPLPPPVRRAMETLRSAGHEVALVGGTLRDRLRDRQHELRDWDMATAAGPEVVAGLFPGSTWLNRFGTVTLAGTPTIEITTYRAERGYRDRRRPDEVRFGVTLDEDLARRDFTINAVAWVPTDLAAGRGVVHDPFGGVADLAAGVLRAVGDPGERFAEDALRLVRGVRFAGRFGLAIDPATATAMHDTAPTIGTVSGERLRDELLRMLRSDEEPWHDAPPSSALRLMETFGLLSHVLPELAALRGVPQGKPLPGDALDHSLRTLDALPVDDPILRLAGLLHDLGKARTLADGHFHGHEEVGAELAALVLARLRLPLDDAACVTHLVRQHMFAYAPDWTDAAVRRFVRRVGREALDDLFALRAADNAASGVDEPETGGLDELRRRIAAIASEAPLETRQLAVDGFDLQEALGLPPSPEIGRLLGELLEATIEDPSLNERAALIGLARRLHSGVD
jgi:tRNA nucleotidyltransferase/poly(A) polymerase